MTSLTVQPGQPAPAKHDRAVPPATRRPGFAGTLRSEFTKISSVRSTYFTLIAFFLAGIGFAVIAAAGNRANGGRAGFDATAMSLHGVVNVGELIIVVIGALVITSEYGTRMISTSLTAMPRRGVLYAAKIAVLACVTFAVALVMAFASFFAGQAVLGSSHGGASIASPDALRSVLLAAVFVTCCALLAFGLGAVIRYTAGAVTTLFGLVFVIPLLAQVLPTGWFQGVARWLPGGPALNPIIATTTAPNQTYLFGPYGELAVFAGYAAVALIAGFLLFRRRDA
jgi:ABC-2 type transport system permease protein